MHYTRSPYYQRTPRRRGVLTALVCLVVVLSIGWIVYTKARSAHGNAEAPASSITAAKKATLAHETALASATQKIKAVLAEYPSVRFSVALYDFSDKSTTHIGSTSAFDAASTGKLITATDFLAQIEKGSYSLDDTLDGTTIGSLLQALIVQSDDTAWQTLNDELGHDQMNTFAQGIGLESYDADTNTMTADDAVTILQKLYTHDLLSDEHTSLLLGYMSQANYRDYIVAAAAPAVTYHKVGWNGSALNDVALIDNGSNHFALAIYTDSDESLDWTTRGAAIRAITTAAMTGFFTGTAS